MGVEELSCFHVKYVLSAVRVAICQPQGLGCGSDEESENACNLLSHGDVSAHHLQSLRAKGSFVISS